MRNQAFLEMTFHDGVVVFDEDVAGQVHQLVDEHGTKESHAFVDVGHVAVNVLLVLVESLVFVRVEKRDKAVLDGLRADDAAFVGVFHVEDEVADVVGGFHHVGQWVTGVDKMLVVDSRYAAFVDDLFEGGNLRIKDIVFLAVAFVEGRVGVFQ